MGKIVDFQGSPSAAKTHDPCVKVEHFAPTVIVRSPRELPAKCSILPLRGRADLIFLNHPCCDLPDLSSYVRLAPEGPELSAADAAAGLLLLDGSWRHAGLMTRAFRDVPPRSLNGYRSAYPRRSKVFRDPENGLATIEALFLAYHLLRRPTEGLLDRYRWAAEFLRLNALEG
jgi:pre-rRNA-processing protein TSR3